MTSARRLRWSALESGLALETGQSHRLIIDRRTLHRLEIEDAYFNAGSGVLLPEVPGPKATGQAQAISFSDDAVWKELAASHEEFAKRLRERPYDPASGADVANRQPGLGVLIVALRFLQRYEGHRLLVAGHADGSGDRGDSLRVSAARAHSVVAVLMADRNAFVDACRQFHLPEDDCAVLRYMAGEHGWDCDPGTEQTPPREAVQAFQSTYNERFSQSVAVDGVVTDETCGAYFDIYQDDLAAMAGGLDELRTLMRGLRFVSSEDKVLPCGDRYPPENPCSRRVELLFFEPHDIPDPADERTQDLLYKHRLFRFETVDPGELPGLLAKASGAGGSFALVDAPPPEPGVGDPDEPLQTEMIAVGERDARDPWAFLEPFDATQPAAGRQAIHVVPGPDGLADIV
jgi:hypothetical protein